MKKKLSKNRERKLTTRKYCFTLLLCVVKVPKHGQQKTCILFCNIAAKRFE